MSDAISNSLANPNAKLAQFLDVGPQTIILWSALRSRDQLLKLQQREEKPTILSGQSLQRILESLQDLLSNFRRNDVFDEFSLAKWIHATNEIEGESLPHYKDTEDLVAGRAAADSPEGHLVVNLLRLCRETYHGNTGGLRPLSDLKTITPEVLQRWHAVIFGTTTEPTSAFRKSGVQSFGDNHVYPHHRIVSTAIETLCAIIRDLVSVIEKLDSPLDNLEATFALAAFAHFHFVDIHPFSDGNGRMCRFLAKFILDCVLPLPFPMYNNREEYLNTLRAARTVSPVLAPRELFLLSLREARVFYAQLATLAPCQIDVGALPGSSLPAEKNESGLPTEREREAGLLGRISIGGSIAQLEDSVVAVSETSQITQMSEEEIDAI